MKKKLRISALAAGLAVTTGGAHAQSSVTLYGKIDAGITYVSNAGGSHQYKFDDSVLSGNRWGLKGTEDLGGGLKAIFTLENGFALGTGRLRQGGAEFGRQAFVGLQNNWGALTLGHQYDFVNDYLLNYTPSAYGSGYALHQGDFDRTNGDRLDNAVKFSSADWHGLTVGAMYAFGNVAGNFHANSAWSAGANYTNGPFAAALVYTRVIDPVFDPYAQIGVKSFLGRTAATVDPATGAVTDPFAANGIRLDSQGILGVGASYTIGKATLMANFTDTTLKLSGTKSSMYVGEVGGTYQVTPALSAIGGYQHTNFEGTHWNHFTLGLDYFISKRTDLYVSGDFLQASNGTNPVIGYSFTPSLSSRQIDMRLGMRTAF